MQVETDATCLAGDDLLLNGLEIHDVLDHACTFVDAVDHLAHLVLGQFEIVVVLVPLGCVLQCFLLRQS
jgi:hypothetical protein